MTDAACVRSQGETDLEDIVIAARRAIRTIHERLSPSGLREGDGGGFSAGHLADKGPHFFAARVYRGLSNTEIDELEQHLPYSDPKLTQAHLPDALRTFYGCANGLRLHNLDIGGAYWLMTTTVGAPIGLRSYIMNTPLFIKASHFPFGSINGEWSSQGHLYLTPDGKVQMVHRDHMLIGMIWDSFADFLTSEVERQLTIHGGAADVLPGCRHLPGDTDDWERLAQK